MKTNHIKSDIPYESSQAKLQKFFKLYGLLTLYDKETAIREIIDFEKNNLIIAKINSNKKPFHN